MAKYEKNVQGVLLYALNRWLDAQTNSCGAYDAWISPEQAKKHFGEQWGVLFNGAARLGWLRKDDTQYVITKLGADFITPYRRKNEVLHHLYRKMEMSLHEKNDTDQFVTEKNVRKYRRTLDLLVEDGLVNFDGMYSLKWEKFLEMKAEKEKKQ